MEPFANIKGANETLHGVGVSSMILMHDATLSGEPSTSSSPCDVKPCSDASFTSGDAIGKRRSFAVDVGHERRAAHQEQAVSSEGGYSAPASAFSPTIRKRSNGLHPPPPTGKSPFTTDQFALLRYDKLVRFVIFSAWSRSPATSSSGDASSNIASHFGFVPLPSKRHNTLDAPAISVMASPSNVRRITPPIAVALRDSDT